MVMTKTHSVLLEGWCPSSEDAMSEAQNALASAFPRAITGNKEPITTINVMETYKPATPVFTGSSVGVGPPTKGYGWKVQFKWVIDESI